MGKKIVLSAHRMQLFESYNKHRQGLSSGFRPQTADMSKPTSVGLRQFVGKPQHISLVSTPREALCLTPSRVCPLSFISPTNKHKRQPVGMSSSIFACIRYLCQTCVLLSKWRMTSGKGLNPHSIVVSISPMKYTVDYGVGMLRYLTGVLVSVT